MLINLLNAITYWFNKDTAIPGLKEEWTKWIWLVVLGLGVLLLLSIIVLFFKAIRRTRQRKVERRIQKEVAAATKADKKAEKEEEKRRKEEEKRQKNEKKSKKKDKEQDQEQQPTVVAAAVEERSVERVLTGITLDVGVVQRDFKVGDEFNCDGLMVNASFNLAPMQEMFANISVVDQSTFEMAVNGTLSGVYVCRPDLSKAGKTTVRVCFNKQLALYTISVAEKPQEEPKKEEKHPEPQPVAAVAVAEPQQQQQTGPREMISLTVNTDYVRRDFYAGDNFNYEGLIVNAHFNREPFKEQVYNYTVVAPDMSRAGNPTVVVMYQGRASSYTITVRSNPYAQQPQQQQYQPYAQPQPQSQPQKERVLTYVSVNSDFAKKDYTVGDQFSREGLMVTAHYNVEPLTEQVTNFTVIPPDMNREGMATVMVAYQDRMVSYQINVRPAPVVAKAEPVVAPIVEQPKKAERELMSVTLDTGIVQREFEAGDEFNCDGLLVNGNYSLAPTLETYADYNVIDKVSFDQVMHADADGVFVCEPDMSTAGKKVVRVCFKKHIALYTISVRKTEAKPEQQVEPQPQPQPEPKVVVVEKEVSVTVEPDRQMLYITVASDDVQKTFTVGDYFTHEGLIVRAHYNAEPYMELVEDYKVTPPDMNSIGRYTVGVHYNGKTAGYQVTIKPAAAAEEKKPEPQPVVVEQQPQVIVQKATPIVVEEESYEGRLRYDRSFQARVIQSDDKTKYWYTDVKNELLSYKGCKGRLSWKRETFKAAKRVVAMLAFRGNTLCLFLALNANEYENTKYTLEDVSNVPAYRETPAMLRLKNDKRVKQAIELIEEVMSELDVDKDKKYQPEDFYAPYEGVFELIKKGLIKREIKTAADEALFNGDKADDVDDDSYELEEVAPGVYISPKK